MVIFCSRYSIYILCTFWVLKKFTRLTKLYFGSVRFFKHLILSTVALMIIVPTVLAVYFGVSNHQNKLYAEQLEMQINSSQQFGEQHTIGISPNPEISVPSYEYQAKYPDLYVENNSFVKTENDRPVIYLTFDDGPSHNTTQVLDILKANNIKATFFVVNSNIDGHEALYRRIVEEGHTIGIHTYSHQYKNIYSSVDDYLADFEKMFNKVYEITGVKPDIFRFPGGSINVYNQDIYVELIAEMLRRGFTYYDWNVSSGDAGQTYTAAQIQNAVIQGVGSKDKSIVLMHDSSTKQATVAALQGIIDNFSETHDFRALNSTVEPAVFTYIDNNIGD